MSERESTEQWRVEIESGSIVVDASTASEARREAIQAFAEDLSLFGVAPVLVNPDYACGAAYCDDPACNTHGIRHDDDD